MKFIPKKILKDKEKTSSYKDLFFQAEDSFADILEIDLSDLSIRRYSVDEYSIRKFYLEKKWPEIENIFFECVIDEDKETIANFFNQDFFKNLIHEPGQKYSINFRCRSEKYTNNELRWYNVKIKATLKENTKIATIFIKDVTIDEYQRQKMREKTDKDSETLLPSKLNFEEKVSSAYKDLDSCGVIIFEIGNLEFYQKIYGENIRDFIMNKFADVIHSAISKKIDIYKFSDKEIIIIGMNVKDSESKTVFDLVSTRIQHLNDTENLRLVIYSGKAFSPAPYNIDELINSARKELFNDKQKNTIDSDNKNFLQNVFFQNHILKLRRYLSDIYIALDEINLETDEFISFLRPTDFSKLNYQPSGKFSETVSVFAKKFLSKEFVEQYIEFCSIENISKLLTKEDFVELSYELNDPNLENPSRKVIFKVLERKDKKPIKVIMAHSFLDKTNEERMYLSFKQSNKYMAEVESERKHFLSKFSHELRTPLTSIIGNTNFAKKNLDNTEIALKYLETVSQSANDLLNRINRILTLSRLDADFENKKTEVFNINDVINQELCNMKILADDNKQNLIFDSSVKYPNVYSYKETISAIIKNLVSNAIKYKRKAGTNVKVTLKQYDTETKNKKFFMLYVEDKGIGMTKKFLESLFIPFSKEKSEEAGNPNSTGLGLYYTKEWITNLLNGTIKCDSKRGSGTTFTISFASYVKIEEENKTDSSKKSINNSASYKGKKILLVEDNLINAEIAADLISEYGIQVEIAHDGNTALEIFKEAPAYSFDLIFMDIRMKDIDGYETTKEIRQIASDYAKNIPIIALTADSFITESSDIFEAGMNGALLKPINRDDLTNILQAFSNRSVQHV